MPSKVHARSTLVILTALNFLNYIDRSVLFATQPMIQHEFHVSDTEIGFLTTAFFICYMATAPLLGLLADRYARRPIIIVGALVWSAATLLTAVTWDFRTLLVRHIVVGIGEASFVASAPSYIADLFSEEKRGRMLSVYFMAIPAGTALGYMVGGYLGFHFGWRTPFYVVAAPGLLLALAMLGVKEPERGALDTVPATAERATLRGLLVNRAYWAATLGMAMMTFALGGLQVWMPTFLSRVRGMSLLRANVFFAVITAINGVVATLSGGWLADRLLRRRSDAYYLVSGAAMAISTPLMFAAIYVGGPAMFPLIFVAEFCVLFNTGPLNAAVVDSVGANIRASAIALNLIVIHLLGDAASPTLMGYISDRTGSLQTAFLAGIAAVTVSAAILLYGRRYAPELHPQAAAGNTRSPVGSR
jgi:predicted MFS family arabinose efflux permease